MHPLRRDRKSPTDNGWTWFVPLLTRVVPSAGQPFPASAFETGLLSSVLLYVHRDRRDCLGRVQVGGQCCFTSTETVRTIRDGHLEFHTAPGL